ncbi:PDZ domain-containing protein [Nocardioides cynanchi]|uniref:YlbL family protein n=1 Tax=Nocardioides cynanchi TaxID=2558918 RepID=UPI00124884D9|nr:PDZ domain-containing protein [Nocardioides cynanchi]
MTQRTLAALLAVPLFVALGLYIAISPLPYVTYAPGLTVNVLGDNGNKPIITVQGHRTYRDSGELRMTTVSVTERNAKLDLFTLLRTWASRDDAIYPYAIQYGDSGSQQQDAQQGQVEMVTSQDSAVAAALTQLGINIHAGIEIVGVTPGMPADGQLQVRDILRSVAGHPVGPKTDVGALLQAVPAGTPVPIVVDRNGHRVRVSITPTTKAGHQVVGITLQVGYTFPFKVSVAIPDNIGGPSAGLMFALSIYDTLTPGSLTGGQVVAGTGTITADGTVGEIGGIQQKIAGARQDGAHLFLVPPANCADALGGDNGSMRLVKAPTLSKAISEVQAWSANHDAPLPSCGASS